MNVRLTLAAGVAVALIGGAVAVGSTAGAETGYRTVSFPSCIQAVLENPAILTQIETSVVPAADGLASRSDVATAKTRFTGPTNVTGQCAASFEANFTTLDRAYNGQEDDLFGWYDILALK